jgi:hypothetical protein
MTRGFALAALCLVIVSGVACGKYGKPRRVSPPASPTAGVSAQPGAAAPAGEECAEEETSPETPAP